MTFDKVRVRFAPSPTGNPHIGNFRTALYNYLFARHYQGRFLLRIEDTDKERSKPEYAESILDGLRWMGLDWDEEPVYQSTRVDRHREMANRLLVSGHAYRCRCAPERLEALRERQMAAGQTPRYDGLCRDLDHPDDGTPFCIRLKTPEEGVIVIHDPIRGDVSVGYPEIDDLVIMRTDGTPTFNFAVVIDDHDMEITHVIRGDDHMRNTFRQSVIYRAFGFVMPVFAHLPQILGQDKARLSKRHGATGVLEYRDQGYLPEALINYLARLGWGHGDREFFTKDELINLFTLEGCNKSAAAFDPQKLLWLNGEHIRALSVEELSRRFGRYASDKGILTRQQANDPDFLIKIAACTRERSKTLAEMALMVRFVFVEEVEYSDEEAAKHFSPEALKAMEELAAFVSRHKDRALTHQDWEHGFKTVMETCQIKMKPFAQAVRLALTGSIVSPPIFDVLDLLGNAKVEQRLKNAVKRIKP